MALLMTCSAMAEDKFIQTYSIKLKEEASFISKSIGTLHHKDKVELLDESGAFVKVQAGELSGWIPKSAITSEKRIKLKAGSRVTTSRSAAMAAGKGLAASEGNDPATAGELTEGKGRVDQIENETPPTDDLSDFVREGGFEAAKKK
jgi:hypothetical protein